MDHRRRSRHAGLRRSLVALVLVTIAKGAPRPLHAACPGPIAPPLPVATGCGGGSCLTVIDLWNRSAWDGNLDQGGVNDGVVDENFSAGFVDLAAVRWYEGEHVHTLKTDPTHCPSPDESLHRFCGVTDELSNVLLSQALGTHPVHQNRFRKLRNFVELLRRDELNGLQCWKYKVDGYHNYDTGATLCATDGGDPPVDSATDASLRILGAYGIACAKERAGLWHPLGISYCDDYERQGNAIWVADTAAHTELKYLAARDEYYLTGGFRNQPSAPSGDPGANPTFWPDYFELQFLMDYAWYQQDGQLERWTAALLGHQLLALGTNHVPIGKRGRFLDETLAQYECRENCSPPYLDNIDTWRVMPHLGSYFQFHHHRVSTAERGELFDYWWDQYGGGNYPFNGALPFEIYSNIADSPGGNPIRSDEHSYRTLGMWLPLAAACSASYTSDAVGELIGKFQATPRSFETAAYFGGYYSQYAIRGIAAATGMLDPRFWTGEIFSDSFEKGSTLHWIDRQP